MYFNHIGYLHINEKLRKFGSYYVVIFGNLIWLYQYNTNLIKKKKKYYDKYEVE